MHNFGEQPAEVANAISEVRFRESLIDLGGLEWKLVGQARHSVQCWCYRSDPHADEFDEDLTRHPVGQPAATKPTPAKPKAKSTPKAKPKPIPAATRTTKPKPTPKPKAARKPMPRKPAAK